MIAINCDKLAECKHFRALVNPGCCGAILLEDLEDWYNMNQILRTAKMHIDSMAPGDASREVIEDFIRTVSEGIL